MKLKKIIFIFAAAAIWTIALLYSQNTLLFNPYWDSSYAVTGGLRSAGLDAILSRQPLSHNRLNPGNHGLRQKVITRKDYDWKRITLSAEMNPFSYFDLLLHSPEGVEGVRISSHTLYPSMRYKEVHPDSFHQIETFPLKPQETKLNLELERGGSIFVNGSKVHTSASVFPPGKIEISVSNASVRDLSVYRPDETKLSFLRTESFWKYFSIHLLVISAISIFAPYQVPMFIFLLGVIWTGFDYTIYSNKHFKLNQASLEYKSLTPGIIDLENLRHIFFKSWFHIVGGETVKPQLLVDRYGHSSPSGEPLLCNETGCAFIHAKEISKKKEKDEFRIFILGGSLTDGWGLALPEETVYPLHLQKTLGVNKQVSILTSISPYISFYRHLDPKDYQRRLLDFRPDLILLDVSPRFTDQKEFSEFLRELMNSKIPVMAFLAPVDVLSAAPEFFLKPEAVNMREDDVSSLMRKSGVTIISNQAHFLKPELYLKNNLFLDHSHLTSIGHRELGNLLAAEIQKIIPRPAPKSSHRQ